MELPSGFKVEKLASGLHLPTSVTWDDQGNIYVAEAGGGLFLKQLAPMRIVQIMEDGSKVVVADLSNQGIQPAIAGLLWHQGYSYFTHRAQDLTGAVSRIAPGGQVELVFRGIVDNQAEHQINDIQVGPDGMMYVAVGPAGNSGVVGPDIGIYVKESPNVHPRPCQDIVLTGRTLKPQILELITAPQTWGCFYWAYYQGRIQLSYPKVMMRQ
jgi:glucose/arabinose dehydrogenase